MRKFIILVITILFFVAHWQSARADLGDDIRNAFYAGDDVGDYLFNPNVWGQNCEGSVKSSQISLIDRVSSCEFAAGNLLIELTRL